MKECRCIPQTIQKAAGPYGRPLLLALMVAAAVPGTAQAQDFVFGTATLKTGGTPTAIAQGDFNGDGVMDFVVSNTGSNTISVFLSNPNGSYAAKTDYAVSTPGPIAVGDSFVGE